MLTATAPGAAATTARIDCEKIGAPSRAGHRQAGIVGDLLAAAMSGISVAEVLRGFLKFDISRKAGAGHVKGMARENPDSTTFNRAY
jgi:hypothetical protein